MHDFTIEQWQNIWDESEIPMAFVGPNHRFVRPNRAYCSFTGYARSELVGRTWQSITHPDDVAGDEASANELQASREDDSYAVSKRYITKSGEVVFVKLHVRGIWVEDVFRGYYVVALPIPHTPTASMPPQHKPFKITEWVVENPKDAAIVGLTIFLLVGRDAFIEFVKNLFIK